MMLASQALTMTIGLIITFGGLGVVVNGLIVYILVQVRGEHQQNIEYRTQHRDQPG